MCAMRRALMARPSGRSALPAGAGVPCPTLSYTPRKQRRRSRTLHSLRRGERPLALAMGPEYLPGDQHLPVKRVRCPVQGFVRYSEAEQAVIDRPEFQRLRNIRQLAFTHYVYPGAMHTRFEHSLGVMDLAVQAFDRVVLANGPLLVEHIGSVPAFSERPLAKARQLVRLMGLLHDVGHTAFSHAGEGILPSKHHELVS